MKDVLRIPENDYETLLLEERESMPDKPLDFFGKGSEKARKKRVKRRRSDTKHFGPIKWNI